MEKKNILGGIILLFIIIIVVPSIVRAEGIDAIIYLNENGLEIFRGTSKNSSMDGVEKLLAPSIYEYKGEKYRLVGEDEKIKKLEDAGATVFNYKKIDPRISTNGNVLDERDGQYIIRYVEINDNGEILRDITNPIIGIGSINSYIMDDYRVLNRRVLGLGYKYMWTGNENILVEENRVNQIIHCYKGDGKSKSLKGINRHVPENEVEYGNLNWEDRNIYEKYNIFYIRGHMDEDKWRSEDIYLGNRTSSYIGLVGIKIRTLPKAFDSFKMILDEENPPVREMLIEKNKTNSITYRYALDNILSSYKLRHIEVDAEGLEVKNIVAEEEFSATLGSEIGIKSRKFTNFRALKDEGKVVIRKDSKNNIIEFKYVRAYDENEDRILMPSNEDFDYYKLSHKMYGREEDLENSPIILYGRKTTSIVEKARNKDSVPSLKGNLKATKDEIKIEIGNANRDMVIEYLDDGEAMDDKVEGNKADETKEDEVVEDELAENDMDKDDEEDSIRNPEKPGQPVKLIARLNRDNHMAYMNGYEDGRFKPATHITRGEVAVIFSRLIYTDDEVDISKNDFNDVGDDMWYRDAIILLSRYGVLNGYEDGSFRPEEAISRAEFATIVTKFESINGKPSKFIDITSDHWAKSNIEKANTKGWVAGYEDGSFKPDISITREEAITLINRVLGRQGDKDFITKNKNIKSFTDVSELRWSYLGIQEACNSHTYKMDDEKETWIKLKK